MKFCSSCGQPTAHRVPDDDTRLRHVCTGCGSVHYLNPKVIVGTLPVWEGRVLLCRRAIEPRQGFWTLPAGFLECDETLQEGAHRETLEESGANVDLVRFFSILDVPHVSQVHIYFFANMLNPDHCAGTESLEVAFFSPDEIPWHDLAFNTVAHTLRHWIAHFDGEKPLLSGRIHATTGALIR